MGQFSVGQSVRRVEDQRFLTGQSQYVDKAVEAAPGAGEAGAIGDAARRGEARAGRR